MQIANAVRMDWIIPAWLSVQIIMIHITISSVFGGMHEWFSSFLLSFITFDRI